MSNSFPKTRPFRSAALLAATLLFFAPLAGYAAAVKKVSPSKFNVGRPAIAIPIRKTGAPTSDASARPLGKRVPLVQTTGHARPLSSDSAAPPSALPAAGDIRYKTGASLAVLKTFKNVVFDLRGSRGGQGDVAAGYLTALDLTERLGYEGPVRFIADAPARKVLSAMTGQEVIPGKTMINGAIEVLAPEHLSPEQPPVGLYLSLARPSGAFPDGPFTKVGVKGALKYDSKSVFVAQTVLGNTENSDSEHPLGTLNIGGKTGFNVSPPGLAPSEGGVYYDPVALRLRGRSPDEVRRFVLQAAGEAPAQSLGRRIQEIIGGQALVGSRIMLAYGITTIEYGVQNQVGSYLQALLKDAKRAGRSYTLITPSGFNALHYGDFPGKEDILVFPSAQALPRQAEAGKIYVVKTGPLPHKLFVGLMAYSMAPPILAGDGSLSAAVLLGKPFVSTVVPWNKRNLENLAQLLEKRINPSPGRSLISKLYRPKTHQKNGGDTLYSIDAGQALNLNRPSITAAFNGLARRVPFLSDSLFEAVAAAQNLLKNDRPFGRLIRRTKDLQLRVSMLWTGAQLNRKGARHALANFLARNGEYARAMLRTNTIPKKLLRDPEIRGSIRKYSPYYGLIKKHPELESVLLNPSAEIPRLFKNKDYTTLAILVDAIHESESDDIELEAILLETLSGAASGGAAALIGKMINNNDVALNGQIAKRVLSQRTWRSRPELVDALIASNSEIVDNAIALYILPEPHSKGHPEWVETLIERCQEDYIIGAYVLTKNHWPKEWTHFWKTALKLNGAARKEFIKKSRPYPPRSMTRGTGEPSKPISVSQ